MFMRKYSKHSVKDVGNETIYMCIMDNTGEKSGFRILEFRSLLCRRITYLHF